MGKVNFTKSLFIISKVLAIFFISLALNACEEENELSLKKGFDIISKDRNTYFVVVGEDYLGDRYAQRQEGYKICDHFKREEGYCEVLFFSSRNEIPTKFPIINRTYPMGKYKVHYGTRFTQVLPAPPDYETDNKVVVLLKDFYRNYLNRKKAEMN